MIVFISHWVRFLLILFFSTTTLSRCGRYHIRIVYVFMFAYVDHYYILFIVLVLKTPIHKNTIRTRRNWPGQFCAQQQSIAFGMFTLAWVRHSVVCVRAYACVCFRTHVLQGQINGAFRNIYCPSLLLLFFRLLIWLNDADFIFLFSIFCDNAHIYGYVFVYVLNSINFVPVHLWFDIISQWKIIMTIIHEVNNRWILHVHKWYND